MKATDVLIEEHQVIQRVVTALGKAASALEQGQPVRPGFFLETAEFIRMFADGCHHHKEEEVLFPGLEAHRTLAQNGLIATMLAEHVRGRLYSGTMRQAARRLGRGDESARPLLIRSALAYAQLLSLHIEKEDGVVFPLADQLLSSDQQQQMAALFQRLTDDAIRCGFQGKYLALASALETEANRV